MELLDNPVRAYAWGSRTVIPDLLGQEVPSPHPQAEMWLGAHPADSSRLVHADGGRTSLLDALGADPKQLLGPLSLQAHPSIEQARAGFAREEAAGIARDASDRNYKDANHKPELICALTELHALVGFRDPAVTVRLLRALEVPELAGHAELTVRSDASTASSPA